MSFISLALNYILYANRVYTDRRMSTLDRGVNFIHSDYQLFKARHGDSFSMDVDIDPAHLHYELPALSLQLLVENAVKHNVVSRQRPLPYLSFLPAPHISKCGTTWLKRSRRRNPP